MGWGANPSRVLSTHEALNPVGALSRRVKRGSHQAPAVCAPAADLLVVRHVHVSINAPPAALLAALARGAASAHRHAGAVAHLRTGDRQGHSGGLSGSWGDRGRERCWPAYLMRRRRFSWPGGVHAQAGHHGEHEHDNLRAFSLCTAQAARAAGVRNMLLEYRAQQRSRTGSACRRQHRRPPLGGSHSG